MIKTNPPGNLVPGLSDLKFTMEQKSNILAIFSGKDYPCKVDLKKRPERESLELLENVLGRVGLWPLPPSGVVEVRKYWKRTNVETTPRAGQNGKRRSRSRLICFQCSCGVDGAQRKDNKGTRKRVAKNKYTGCLVHCRISVAIVEDGEKDVEGPIRWFQGYFDHNHGCVDALVHNGNLESNLETHDTHLNGNSDEIEVPSETVTQSEASPATRDPNAMVCPTQESRKAAFEQTLRTKIQRFHNAIEFALSEYNELSRFLQENPEETEGTELAELIKVYKDVMEQMQKLHTDRMWDPFLSTASHPRNVRTATSADLSVERQSKQPRHDAH